jgi:hypothetical protein
VKDGKNESAESAAPTPFPLVERDPFIASQADNAGSIPRTRSQ